MTSKLHKVLDTELEDKFGTFLKVSKQGKIEEAISDPVMLEDSAAYYFMVTDEAMPITETPDDEELEGCKHLY